MHSSINRSLLFTLFILFLNPKSMRLLLPSSSETRMFDLDSLPHGYLTYLGDSHRQHRAIVLTKQRNNVPRSVGVVLYRHPILIRGSQQKKVPSFYTMFTFSIENNSEDKKRFGDGLAFLMSTNEHLLGSPGYLGLVDSTDLTKNRFIAIEFDTKRDSMFLDPDDNHVGLDINNLSSVKLATSSSLGMDLKSGDLIHTWIDYTSDENRLEVFLSDSYLKPKNPLLKVDIDLSNYLKDNVFVGFSAATEGSMQLTRIEQWELTIMEVSPPPPPPLNESERTFSNPSESGHREIHVSRFAIGLMVGACFIPFVGMFGWFCWKKLMAIIQKPEGTNNLEMQTIRSSARIPSQEIQFSGLVDEVARGLNVEKVLDNLAELIRVTTVKSSIPLCNNLPAVKRNALPLCNGLPLRQMTSLQFDDG